MFKRLSGSMEPNRRIRTAESVILFILAAVIIICYGWGFSRINKNVGEIHHLDPVEMLRDDSEEDYDDSYTVCDVIYRNSEDFLTVRYTYEDYIELETDTITAYGVQTSDGTRLFFNSSNITLKDVEKAYKENATDQMMTVFNLANSLVIVFLSVWIVMFFSTVFSTYEKIWFVSIMVLATIFAVLFPEESANGVNGIIIMLLYLLDTFLNILCELLISKQSRYNFLVSVRVEITEIAICIVLMYRFATMVTTLFFWLPIDILSFINWSKHKDDQQDELTMVRRLKGYQEVLILIGIAVWTVVVGYFLSGLDIKTDFFTNRTMATTIAYLDACASAVGVANGLFIFFRLREQWIAWYACALLESIINVLSGQYVLLILKLGYFTNTTYGYIKWTRYIRSHSEEQPSLF